MKSFNSINDSFIFQSTPYFVSPLVIFAHDLIQEQVYEGIPAQERRQLHLDIGLFLGSKAPSGLQKNESIVNAMDQLFLSEESDDGVYLIEQSSLISIATSQINLAGSKLVDSQAERIQIAKMNLRAGREASERSSFRKALYYYKHGIAFLEDTLWLDIVYELCLQLHQGAAFAVSALGGEASKKMRPFANAIIENASFEESLIAQDILIRSFELSGDYEKAIERGLAVLRQLKFDIPNDPPTPPLLMQSLIETEQLASMHSYDNLAEEFMKCDPKTRNALRILDSISHSCYQVGSPYLALVSDNSYILLNDNNLTTELIFTPMF
jgi:predicted ATPase